MLIHKKLVIVGQGYCGKSALLWVYKYGRIPDEVTLVKSYFETYEKNITMDDRVVSLVIHDTPGCDMSDKIRSLTYSNADVILICHSVDNPDLLENVTEFWLPEIKLYCPKIPIILVLTKTDLRIDSKTIEELNKKNLAPINREEGQKLADKIKATYVECSAKNNDGVKEVFEVAVRAALFKNTSGCCSIS